MTNTKQAHNSIINGFLIILSILFIVPIILILSISFTEESALLRNGYRLIPIEWTVAAYKVILLEPALLLKSYVVTIGRTVVGTVVGLLFTTLIAYTISRRDFLYRRQITFFIFFTMLFHGGLVPTYILITRYLHLKDNFLVMILPVLLNPFLVMVMKGFLGKIPLETIESAKIDGASEWRIFYRIVIPLSAPALSTVGLITAFYHWNDWWLPLLYIDQQNLVPLQLMLYRMMGSIDFLRNNLHLMGAGASKVDLASLPNLSMRMAMVVLAAGPMMFIFPFFQKHFVTGLTVGSLKE